MSTRWASTAWIGVTSTSSPFRSAVGPWGVETIAAALSEPRDAIEDIIEPYLIQLGFLQRTPRGRLLTPHAFRHLGLKEPKTLNDQIGLFGDEAAEDA